MRAPGPTVTEGCCGNLVTWAGLLALSFWGRLIAPLPVICSIVPDGACLCVNMCEGDCNVVCMCGFARAATRLKESSCTVPDVCSDLLGAKNSGTTEPSI